MTDQLESEVAARLHALMAEFGVSTNKEMADLCGATNSAVNNWRLGYNLPRVPAMTRLCERKGITLDWVYRGHVGSMDPKLAIKLNRRVATLAAQQRPISSSCRRRSSAGDAARSG